MKVDSAVGRMCKGVCQLDSGGMARRDDATALASIWKPSLHWITASTHVLVARYSSIFKSEKSGQDAQQLSALEHLARLEGSFAL